MVKTFCVKNLGCKVNAYESEYITFILLNSGYKKVLENADIYIINTCTVTNESDKKSKKTINSIRRRNPKSIVIAVGCYTQYLYNTNKNIDINADIILGNYDKSKILDYIKEFESSKKQIIKFYNMDMCNFENMETPYMSSHTRAFIKIEDGCNNFCSYCVIPFVRGNVRSKKKESVIEEAKKLVKNGHKEIILTGIHTGQYGSDLSNCDLFKLLLDLIEIEKLERIRISSIEIVEINDRIISLLSHAKIASHLHLPLQSGCDKILKLMNRKYDTTYYKNTIDKIRKVNPNISITTDVIVGFPGETEEDFKETYEFCKEIGFSKIHVFPFSERSGTEAIKFDDKVSEVIKKERVKELLNLSDELKNNYEKRFLNTNLEVLIEKQDDKYSYGYSSNYIEIKTNKKYKPNNIYKIQYKGNIL